MNYILTCCLATFALCGCVIGFRNSEQNIAPQLRWLYVPAAVDNGTLGGAASRVSYAVRRALALNTRVQMVSLEEARVGLEIQIRDQVRSPAGKVVDCLNSTTATTVTNVANEYIGSKAFQCKELGIAQASLAAESEAIFMYALANLIDLQTGKVIAARVFEISTTHPTISDDETTRNAIRSRRDLHALRYLENHDSAVERLGTTIANGTLNMLATATTQQSLSTP